MQEIFALFVLLLLLLFLCVDILYTEASMCFVTSFSFAYED